MMQGKESQLRIFPEFIEEVPDFQIKLKKYLFNKDFMDGKFSLTSGHRTTLEAVKSSIVRDYGESFVGDIVAGSSFTGGMNMFRLQINKPYAHEFEDILDEKGNLLPEKPKQ